ncbi:Retrovirus-related Pol polyprotein from transposon 17.6, partial [Mucuna pruriens]
MESPTASLSYIWGKGLCLNLFSLREVQENQKKMKVKRVIDKERKVERKIKKKKKKEEKGKESLLVSPREVRRVLLAKRELLIMFPTNMILSTSPSMIDLPTMRGIEHHIDLTFGATLSNRVAYRMNLEEAKEIQKQVGDLMEKSWVKESMGPYAMHEGDEWKTTYKTKFGLYEWLVMPFSLTNVPSTFMRLMNHVLRSLIGKCVVVCFDDILIYSTCLDDHLFHTLFANLDKCIFCTNEVTFLGFVVGSHGVKVDEGKVKVIQDWPTPKIVGEVRIFHGLANFYRRLVKYFLTLESPLNEIESQERIFQVLKERLTQAPILILPNFAKSFKLECDAFNVGIGVLQEGHPIAYFSEKLKELYALVTALQTCQHYLLSKEFVIHSDHEAFKHLRGQARRHVLIAILERKMLELYCIKELYKKDIDFCEPFSKGVNSAFHDYFRHDGFLFKGKKLCVPTNSIQQLLVKETHKGGLMSHLGELKTSEF